MLWDHADNRLSKLEYTTGILFATTTYTTNALNQMTGWGNGATNVVYQYDANGARTNMERNADGLLVTTAYICDEDNRLVQAVNAAGTSIFAYDYRSRRYYRSTPNEETWHVFDGGLSIQEYDATSNPTPQTSNLLTEFIRGEGMGGGVGGMVYSIKDGDIICSHANHRGDVIARTDRTGSLTSFALYKAYGTRPYEWPVGGTGDPDRQKANTKEEESDLDLLNEGMRFRDLETGVFLTRDPIGYGDGPNVYCYVHCNPITRFDPLGLEEYAFYALGKDENAFRNRAEQAVGTGNALGFGSGSNLMGAMKYASSKESISSADIHSHGWTAGVIGSANNDSGFYVNETEGSASSANVENFIELVKSGGIVLDKNCDIRFFGCNNAALAKQVSEELGKIGRDDVTVTGATTYVGPDESSPKDPKTGAYTVAESKFETYKNGEKVGESTTQPYKPDGANQQQGNTESETQGTTDTITTDSGATDD